MRTRAWRLFGLCAGALALGLGAHATAEPIYYANTFGQGTISGTATCASSLAINAKATGFVLNTVITGDVGDITVRGGGSGPCRTTMPVTLSANGVGPTGSKLACPTLTGTYSNTGTTVAVTVTGTCRINNYPTNTRWQVDAAPGFAGTFTVRKV
jgi:hypothetical protein